MLASRRRTTDGSRAQVGAPAVACRSRALASLSGRPINPSRRRSSRHLSMNSCVRWGTSGPTGSRRTASTKRALPTIGCVRAVRVAHRVEHRQRGVLALCLGQGLELVLEALHPLTVRSDPLDRVAGRLDPVDEGVQRDAVVLVMVEHMERRDVAVRLLADAHDRTRRRSRPADRRSARSGGRHRAPARRTTPAPGRS